MLTICCLDDKKKKKKKKENTSWILLPLISSLKYTVFIIVSIGSFLKYTFHFLQSSEMSSNSSIFKEIVSMSRFLDMTNKELHGLAADDLAGFLSY